MSSPKASITTTLPPPRPPQSPTCHVRWSEIDAFLLHFARRSLCVSSPGGGKINKAGLAVASTPFPPSPTPWIATELPVERVSHVNNKSTPLNRDRLSYLFAEMPLTRPLLTLVFREVLYRTYQRMPAWRVKKKSLLKRCVPRKYITSFIVNIREVQNAGLWMVQLQGQGTIGGR